MRICAGGNLWQVKKGGKEVAGAGGVNGGYQVKKLGWGHAGQASPLWGILLPEGGSLDLGS